MPPSTITPSTGWPWLSRLRTDRYTLGRVETAADLDEAQALRFAVFNLELHQGLPASTVTERDADEFDPICEHLIVRESCTNRVIGAYRLQLGETALAGRGYYCAKEFDLEPFAPVRRELMELGRACVHRAHRNMEVLALLWQGLAAFASDHHIRYFMGCSSFSGTDPGSGLAAYEQLRHNHLADPSFRTVPYPSWLCTTTQPLPRPPRLPKLLYAYLSLGAKICGPPAIDPEFGTIDFLTMLDLHQLNRATAVTYLGDKWLQHYVPPAV